MPITNFGGDTFVAFVDISGFKQLMTDGKRAWEAIDRLYQYAYRAIRESNNMVEGLFVSDSGILFVKNYQNKTVCLKALLDVVKKLNKKMLNHDFMLTTSIAYGDFRYQERIEFRGIGKNPIYGNAYLSAFLDNENGKPKIQPGQCRIVKENLPLNIIQSIENNTADDGILRMIKKRSNDANHFYFYWMVNNQTEIDNFEKEFNDAYNLKYAGMLKALKRE